jgi:hypothetical protein
MRKPSLEVRKAFLDYTIALSTAVGKAREALVEQLHDIIAFNHKETTTIVGKGFMILLHQAITDERLDFSVRDLSIKEEYWENQRFQIWDKEIFLRNVADVGFRFNLSDIPQRPQILDDWLNVKLVLVYKEGKPVEMMANYVPEEKSLFVPPDGRKFKVVQVDRLDEDGTTFRIVGGW